LTKQTKRQKNVVINSLLITVGYKFCKLFLTNKKEKL